MRRSGRGLTAALLSLVWGLPLAARAEDLCSKVTPEICERDAAALKETDPLKAQELFLFAAGIYQADCEKAGIKPCGKADELRWQYGRARTDVPLSIESARAACDESPGAMCLRVGDALWLGYGVTEDRDAARAMYDRACRARSYLCKRQRSPETAEQEAPLGWRLDTSLGHIELAKRAQAGGDAHEAATQLIGVLSQTRWKADHARAAALLPPVAEALWKTRVEPRLAGSGAVGALREGELLVRYLPESHPLRAELARARGTLAGRERALAAAAPENSLRARLHAQLAQALEGAVLTKADLKTQVGQVRLKPELSGSCDWIQPRVSEAFSGGAGESVAARLSVSCDHRVEEWRGQETYTYEASELRRRQVSVPHEVTRTVMGTCTRDGQKCFVSTSNTGVELSRTCVTQVESYSCPREETRTEMRLEWQTLPTPVPKQARRAVHRRTLSASVSGKLLIPGLAPAAVEIREEETEKEYQTPHGNSAFTGLTLDDLDARAAEKVIAQLKGATDTLRSAKADEAEDAAHRFAGENDLEQAMEYVLRASLLGSTSAELDSIVQKHLGIPLSDALRVLSGEGALPLSRLP